MKLIFDKRNADGERDAIHQMDRSQRKRSAKLACEMVHRAAECGATRIAFVSGSDPGAAQREAAKSALGETLERISEVMSQYPQMIMQLEPLDRFAHKCQLIGPHR